MRYVYLFLLPLLVSCTTKDELRLSTAENDFIEGTIDDRTFDHASGSFYGYADQYWIGNIADPEGSTADPGIVTGGLSVTRLDGSGVYTVELTLPGVALHRLSFPVSELEGMIVLGTLADDSVVGCPHIDSTSLDLVPVTVTVASWDDNQLRGSFVVADPDRTGSGTFNVLIGRP